MKSAAPMQTNDMVCRPAIRERHWRSMPNRDAEPGSQAAAHQHFERGHGKDLRSVPAAWGRSAELVKPVAYFLDYGGADEVGIGGARTPPVG